MMLNIVLYRQKSGMGWLVTQDCVTYMIFGRDVGQKDAQMNSSIPFKKIIKK